MSKTLVSPKAIMNRRHFLQAGASLATLSFTAHGHAHHHVEAAPYDAAADSQSLAPSGPITSGSGEFRYEYVPEKLALPAEVKMKNGHGLCLDTAGNIYFTFEPEKVED